MWCHPTRTLLSLLTDTPPAPTLTPHAGQDCVDFGIVSGAFIHACTIVACVTALLGFLALRVPFPSQLTCEIVHAGNCSRIVQLSLHLGPQVACARRTDDAWADDARANDARASHDAGANDDARADDAGADASWTDDARCADDARADDASGADDAGPDDAWSTEPRLQKETARERERGTKRKPDMCMYMHM